MIALGAKGTDARKKAAEKYIAEKTDKIGIRVPKGTKDKYKEFAASKGKSLNALIVEMLEDAMKKEN